MYIVVLDKCVGMYSVYVIKSAEISNYLWTIHVVYIYYLVVSTAAKSRALWTTFNILYIV